MFEKILIASDGSKHSQKAAEAGIELARLSKGKATALFVVNIEKEYESMGEVSWNIADDIVQGIRKSLKDCGNETIKVFGEMAKKAGVPFEGKIIEGHPATEIIKMAEDAKMDVIVIGSIGRTGLGKFLLGSVAEKVVRNSKVPVLVVH